MKTPREILLQQHSRMSPELDLVREKVLEGMAAAEKPGPEASGGKLAAIAGKVWRELIWPSRAAWACLCVLWAFLLIANFETKRGSPVAQAGSAIGSSQIVQGFQQQRRVLAELLPAGQPPQTRAAHRGAENRSEREGPFKPC
jgi:hypothetical protein